MGEARIDASDLITRFAATVEMIGLCVNLSIASPKVTLYFHIVVLDIFLIHRIEKSALLNFDNTNLFQA